MLAPMRPRPIIPSCIAMLLRSSPPVLRQVRSDDRRERCDHHRRSRATACRPRPGRPRVAGLHRSRPAGRRAGRGLAVDAAPRSAAVSQLGVLLASFTTGYLVASVATGRLTAPWAPVGSSPRALPSLPPGSPPMPSARCGRCDRRQLPGRDRVRCHRRGVERLRGRAHGRTGAQRSAHVLRVGATLGPLLVTGLLQADASWRVAYVLLRAFEAGLADRFFTTRGVWSTSPPAQSPAPDRPTVLVVLGVLVFFVYVGIEASAGQWSYSLFTEQRGMSTGAAGRLGGRLLGLPHRGSAARRPRRPPGGASCAPQRSMTGTRRGRR